VTDDDLWDSITDDEPQPLEGGERRLGRYVLCRELAAGGMGTIYLARAAEPVGLDRPIAIKVIHRHLARRSDLVAMFQDEARIHARIQHPNVCSVFDFGQADGTFFLAMEYLLGESLATLLREVGRRPALADDARWPALVARMFLDACEGLHAAHELRDDEGRLLGVVHRDVSPQNLFVTYDGHTKVLDFGVALARGRMHETIAGGVKGKLSYMAPEQARLATLDRRADVWALGVCLWEALTARRLFKRASEAGIPGAIDRGELPVPSSRSRAPIPRELDAIVMRALAKDVSARTPSARELGRELGAWLHAYPEPIGHADVAEVLGQLFAPQRGVKREVVQTVLSGPPVVTSLPGAGAGHGGRGTAHAGGLAGGHADPTRTPTVSPRGPLGLPPRIAEEVPAPAPGGGLDRRALWVVGASVLVGAVGIGVGVLIAAGGGGEPTGRLSTLPPLVQPTPDTTALAPATRDAGQDAAAPAIAAAQGASSDEPALADRLRDRPRRRTPLPTEPRPEAGARAPAPGGTGVVNVVTPGGWADVVVGGRVVGRTPRQITLPAGTRTLELRPFGRTPGERVEVVVEAGGTARVVRPVTR
jgi:serine/threonine-protein kinase